MIESRKRTTLSLAALLVAAAAAATNSVATGDAPAAPAPAAVAQVAGESSPLAALAWLADRCWTGTFADGQRKDFICYDWRLGGKFLRSRHRVIGGAGPYSGETWFGWDAATKRLEFSYFNSEGATMRGPIEPRGDELAFPVEKFEMNGKTFELRSSWKRKPEGGYLATTERRVGGEWQIFMTIDFVPAGPASAWTEE